jgi:predicted kinase
MMLHQPTLIVFGGLPGTGKTTISRALSAKLGSAYLRIDAIEQAIKASGVEEAGSAGYAVANAIAEANLRIGVSVTADCVNPVIESRLGWREVAARVSAQFIEIELICSDHAEHRRRVENRSSDIVDHIVPSWDTVTKHHFEIWEGDHLVLDTAKLAPAELIFIAEAYVLDRTFSDTAFHPPH